jgi:hypothetical protein
MTKRKDPTKQDNMIVKRSITSAMKSDMQDARPLVIDPKRRAQYIAHARPPPSINVRQNLLRIVEEADPIGFLISVQKGDLQPVTHVSDNGDLEVVYVQPSLESRIGVAQFLAHKILPSITLKAEVFTNTDEEKEAPVRPGQPGGQTFSEMVNAAAAKVREHAAAIGLPAPEVWEAAPDDGETYGGQPDGDVDDE